MQVFISDGSYDDPFHTYRYYRPLIWAGGNAYVGYEGQSHNDLCWEFDIDPYAGLFMADKPTNGERSKICEPMWKWNREGVMFSDGEIKWREDLGHGVEKMGAEPEPGINGAILDALGSDPDFKFSGWNSRMRIQ